MKTHFKPLAALLLLALCSFCAPPDTFTKLLNRAGLTFEQPAGWVEVPVISNTKMHYDYAIKHPDRNIEIRYTIRPMDSMLIHYEQMRQKPGTVIIHPNKYFKGALMATLMNISSGARPPQGKPFDSLAVKREYGADRGITAMTVPGTAFGQDYKYCMIIALQKDNVGYAYCFTLFNDQEDMKSLNPSVFYSLKFKP